MDDKILIVDDDPHLLAAIQRQLRHRFNIHAATSGEQAFENIEKSGPFSVVISDMRMPGADGVKLLGLIREKHPETVRIILTGYADLQTAIDSVNRGNVFRFLTKPCEPDALQRAIEDGIRQYRLVISEKELLGKTLSSSVKVLSDLLSIVNPTAFGRACRIHRYAKLIAESMNAPNAWEIEVAALLSQIGCVTVPEPILRKAMGGEKLSPAESDMINAHPDIGRDLIAVIPRMEGVAQAIASQNMRYEELTRKPPPAGAESMLAASILKAAGDFDRLEVSGRDRRECLELMCKHASTYNPAVLRGFEKAIVRMETSDRFTIQELSVDELQDKMILAEDVISLNNILLIAKGQEISVPLRLRLRNFRGNAAVREPIKVLVPLKPESDKRPA